MGAAVEAAPFCCPRTNETTASSRPGRQRPERQPEPPSSSYPSSSNPSSSTYPSPPRQAQLRPEPPLPSSHQRTRTRRAQLRREQSASCWKSPNRYKTRSRLRLVRSPRTASKNTTFRWPGQVSSAPSKSKRPKTFAPSPYTFLLLPSSHRTSDGLDPTASAR